MNLNRIASNWSFQERERLNRNWEIIESYFSGLQRQINIISGDEDVQEMIDRINNALNQSELTLDELQTALSDATTVINNVQTATDNANNATQEALGAISDIQNIINDFGSKGEYNNTTTYKRNNVVLKDGCSYIYINDIVGAGNPPPTYPAISNTYWHMLADKGASGSGAVSKVNGKEPNGSGEIILEPTDIGAASSADSTALNNTVATHLVDNTAHNGFVGNVQSLVGLTDFNTFTTPGKYHGVISTAVLNEPIDGGNTHRRMTLEVEKDDAGTLMQTVLYYDTFGKSQKFFRYQNGNWVKDILISDYSFVVDASNGYNKHPSGLIEQWARVTAGPDGTFVTFPTAFPVIAANVQLSILAATGGDTVRFDSLSQSQVRVFCSSTQIVDVRILGW